MSILQYGVRFSCDACQATADSPRPLPGPLRWDDIPIPDGWTALQPMLNLTFTDAYGAMVGHLCAACSALPIRELAAKLKAGAHGTL